MPALAIGDSSLAIHDTQQRVVELAGMPGGWLRLVGVLLLVGLGALVIWFYRRERRAGAGARLRAGLAALRCVVLLGLAAVWLEPVVATYVVRTIDGRVAVLADVSASMSVVDADEPAVHSAPNTESLTRFERVQHLLSADDSQWLRRLQQRNELSLYAFGDETTRLALPWAQPAEVSAQTAPPATHSQFAAPSSLLATAPRTDLGQALATVLDNLSGSPVAGVVLLTDGGVNRGVGVEEMVVLARRFKAPVYPVGVGDVREPPNLRITAVSAPAAVPPGDPFEVRVELAAAGIQPVEVEVELTAEAAKGGGERPVAAQRVVLGESHTPDPLRFEVSPPAPGEYVYRVRVRPLPAEALSHDNLRETTVLVLDQRLRVLVVAGGPTFEYRYLTRLLERDNSIDVSCWLQAADARALRDGNTVIRELPREPADLFAYDAVLLLDPDPGELDASWAVTLRRWVDEMGGGLLLQAGPHFTTRFLRDPRLQELVSILPVSPDPDADMRLSELGTYRAKPSAVRLPAPAAGHPLVALRSEVATNREVWRALPGVWWYLPVLRPKPLATVLLEHAGAAQRDEHGPAVLMAVQPVGAGRAGLLGFSDTWRWRATAEPCFNRFWVQFVRYLGHARRQQASKRGGISLDRESFRVGDYVRIEARVLDSTYAPWHEPRLTATLKWENQTAQDCALAAIPGREGWFAGRLLLEREGPAVLRVPLPSSGAPDAGDETDFLTKRIHVRRPEVEMRSLRLREDLLRALAEQTGGAYSRLADADALPNRIEKASERKPPRLAEAEPLWDRTWVLVVLAALLAVEWALRRRNHLL